MTPQNFLAVLSGKSELMKKIGTGKVINRYMVYWVKNNVVHDSFDLECNFEYSIHWLMGKLCDLMPQWAERSTAKQFARRRAGFEPHRVESSNLQ